MLEISAPAPSPSTSFAQLPAEILNHVLIHLDPHELAQIAQTSRRLKELAYRDSLWESYVQDNIYQNVESSKPFDTFRSLYKVHGPFWFLPRHKIWISDAFPHGKVLLSRYDHRRGCIEAYALAARPREARHVSILRWNHDVVYRSFRPVVELDLNQPLIYLSPRSLPGLEERIVSESTCEGTKFKVENEMEFPSAANRQANHPNRTLMRTRDLPRHLCDSRTSLWPNICIPTPENTRTRAASGNSFTSYGHKPQSARESSTTSFRLKQKLNVFPRSSLQALFLTGAPSLEGFSSEEIETFGTVDPAAYTPTAAKPWQGIYVGDYSTHGCEFLLVTQPDAESARPLPFKARTALKRWPHSTDWQALLTDTPGEEDEVYDDDADILDDSGGEDTETSLTAALQMRRHRINRGERLPEVFPNGNEQSPDSSSAFEDTPFHGRLEAIKLTGDPNVPRGEITFVADDLGQRGLVGYTKEKDFVESRAASEGRFDSLNQQSASSETAADDDKNFKGSRMVRSVGHVCEVTRTARRESYIPSQLVLISPGRLAQWWMPVNHQAFKQNGIAQFRLSAAKAEPFWVAQASAKELEKTMPEPQNPSASELKARLLARKQGKNQETQPNTPTTPSEGDVAQHQIAAAIDSVNKTQSPQAMAAQKQTSTTNTDAKALSGNNSKSVETTQPPRQTPKATQAVTPTQSRSQGEKKKNPVNNLSSPLSQHVASSSLEPGELVDKQQNSNGGDATHQTPSGNITSSLNHDENPQPDVDDWLQLTNYHDREHRSETLGWWREKRELDQQQEVLNAKYKQWDEKPKSGLAASLRVAMTPRVSVQPSVEHKQDGASNQAEPPTHSSQALPPAAHPISSPVPAQKRTEPDAREKRALSPSAQKAVQSARPAKTPRLQDDEAFSNQNDYIAFQRTASPGPKRQINDFTAGRRVISAYNNGQRYPDYDDPWQYDYDHYYRPYRNRQWQSKRQGDERS
ncbi:MAG: hypothetical protein Q9162_000188 [Coniocarpon cinnabarinum]